MRTDDEKNKTFRETIKVGDIITHPEWIDPKDSSALVVYIDFPENVFISKQITEYGHNGNLSVRAMACARGEYAFKKSFLTQEEMVKTLKEMDKPTTKNN